MARERDGDRHRRPGRPAQRRPRLGRRLQRGGTDGDDQPAGRDDATVHGRRPLAVTPGSPITFSGTATDDEGLKNVEITLRNTTTRENLGADGTWGVGRLGGQLPHLPQDINAVELQLVVHDAVQPDSRVVLLLGAGDGQRRPRPRRRPTRVGSRFSAQIPATTRLTAWSPSAARTVTRPATSPWPARRPTTTASQSVQLTVYDNDTGRYMQDNGTMAVRATTLLNATLATPERDQHDLDAADHLPGRRRLQRHGARLRHRRPAGPVDDRRDCALPLLPRRPAAGVRGRPRPAGDGHLFTEGRSSSAAVRTTTSASPRVEVGIVERAGQYMSSTGTFTSTTPSWRTAFLNSPGSPGSNFSYTTPVIPDGTYTRARARRPTSTTRSARSGSSTGIVVTHPAEQRRRWPSRRSRATRTSAPSTAAPRPTRTRPR